MSNYFQNGRKIAGKLIYFDFNCKLIGICDLNSLGKKPDNFVHIYIIFVCVH